MKCKIQTHLLKILSLLLMAFALENGPNCRADHTAVSPITGQSDWSILPPEIPSEYVTFGPDSITIRNMPLKGNFHVAGSGIEIEALGAGILNADLDLAGTGPIWGPLTITEIFKGKEKVIF